MTGTTSTNAISITREADQQRLIEIAAKRAVAVMGESSAPRLAVSGGSALRVASAVRRCWEAAHGRDTWAKVALTWADERWVPHQNDDSNYGAAMQAKLVRGAGSVLPLGVPDLLESLIPSSEDSAPAKAEPDLAAELTSAAFQRSPWFGCLDVALLGMGADGHTASLFPLASRGEASSLGGAEAWPLEPAVAVVRDSPKPPKIRLTFTPQVFATARLNLVFAAGESKRDAIDRVLHGDRDLPLSHFPNVEIYTDLTDSTGPT